MVGWLAQKSGLKTHRHRQKLVGNQPKRMSIGRGIERWLGWIPGSGIMLCSAWIQTWHTTYNIIPVALLLVQTTYWYTGIKEGQLILFICGCCCGRSLESIRRRQKTMEKWVDLHACTPERQFSISQLSGDSQATIDKKKKVQNS